MINKYLHVCAIFMKFIYEWMEKIVYIIDKWNLQIDRQIARSRKRERDRERERERERESERERERERDIYINIA